MVDMILESYGKAADSTPRGTRLAMAEPFDLVRRKWLEAARGRVGNENLIPHESREVLR